MTASNSVLIQLKCEGLIQLINTLDILKQNNVNFNIIEEVPEQKNTNKYNDLKTKKALGNKGLLILKSLADGHSYKDIAKIAEISVDGVRYYIKKIFKTLDVNNGRDAVRVYLTEYAN